MNCRDPTATPSVMLPSVTAEVFGHVPHVTNSPLKWRCIQIVHVVNDFCFQWGSAPLRLWRWRRRNPAEEGRHQDWVAHDVTVFHVPLIRQASVFLQHVLGIMGTSVLSGSPSLKFADAFAARKGFLTFLLPPFLRPGCTPGPSTSPCVLWEEPRRRLAHRLRVGHPVSLSSIHRRKS